MSRETIAALLPLLAAGPIAAAALTVLVPHRTVRTALLLGVPATSALAGLLLLLHHRDDPVLAHRVGDYVPGVAITFASDTFAALMITVTALTTVACVAFAVRSGDAGLRHFPALALMLGGGVNGALLTADLFNLFVFIEVMLLPSYALIAMTGSWRRLGIGRLFVVVNLLTSTLFLIGVALVYGVAGSVNLGVLAGAAREDDRLALAGGVVLLALAVKSGIVPLHGWLPRAYPATSASVMALFSALHTKVALYAIYRVYSVVYDNDDRWLGLVLVLVAVTMLVGAFSSLGERSLRRNLAFQMVAGVGYILVGVGLSTRLGLGAGIFYMLHHIIVMGSLLLLSGAIETTYGTGHFARVSGLMRRDRLLAFGFALAALSLVGFPPSSGFFGKVGVVQALADRGGTTAVVMISAVVLASLGSLLAVQRLWSEVFWGPPMEELKPVPAGQVRPGDGQRTRPVPLDGGLTIARRTLAPGTALLVVSLAVFVGAGPVWDVCLRAAEGLLDAGTYATEVLR